MTNRHYQFNLLLLLVLLCAAGCGTNVPMGGTVTFSDDGSPLTAGTVFFTTDTFEARGMLQSNGTYTIGSVTQADGLPPGKYQVYIRDAHEYRTRNVAEGDTVADTVVPLIDQKYASPATSGLEVEVNSSSQRTFNFTVDRPN